MAAQIHKSQISNLQSAVCNPQSLAAGLLGSLTALVVHGLTDAVTWGTKPAVMVWAVFGVTVALYRLTGDGGEGKEEIGRPSIRRWLGYLLLTFAYWILFSLLAVAFIGSRPYIGLAIALAGGVFLGFYSVMSLEPRWYGEK